MTTITAGSLLQQGLTGIQQSSAQLTQAANTIAGANTGQDQPLDVQRDITEPLIQQREQALVFDASAKVVKTADDMLGVLLDVTA